MNALGLSIPDEFGSLTAKPRPCIVKTCSKSFVRNSFFSRNFLTYKSLNRVFDIWSASNLHRASRQLLVAVVPWPGRKGDGSAATGDVRPRVWSVVP